MNTVQSKRYFSKYADLPRRSFRSAILSALAAILSLAAVSCAGPEKDTREEKVFTGSVIRLDPELDKVIPPGARIEVLASGFDWAEGPLWLEDQQMILFTDVPNNVIYSYSDTDSLKVYLEPSGHTDESPDTGNSGANGLLLSPKGDLVLCQHGDRRVARMRASLENPVPIFQTLAGSYEGKRLNSPNDATYDSEGNLYFTDPPYGLKQEDEDPYKELEMNGVYLLTPLGDLVLLTDELTRPNGIALSPDGNTLYVANSDPSRCIWMAYELTDEKSIASGALFFDATEMFDGTNGLPDGLKVNPEGYILATGPGGVLIFSPEGKHLGTISTGHPTANCCFNADASALYMTADNYLMRIKLIDDE